MMSLRSARDQMLYEEQRFAESEARRTPEERAGDALTAEQVARMLPCPTCGRGIGETCLTPNPVLNKFDRERGLSFAHPERRRRAGAIALRGIAA